MTVIFITNITKEGVVKIVTFNQKMNLNGKNCASVSQYELNQCLYIKLMTINNNSRHLLNTAFVQEDHC